MPRALPLRCLLPFVLTWMLVTGLASVASAVIPSAGASHWDPCLVLCPAGDLSFHVVVRDVGGNPIPRASVRLDFSGCPMFVHCPGIPGPLVVDDVARTVTIQADGQGAAVLAVPMGGICPGSAVKIQAASPPDLGPPAFITMGIISLASPDRDGSLAVDAADQAAVQALVGTTDPTADFNCDGAVTAADVAILSQHLGHMCASPTPSRSRSWGDLKLIYR